MKNLLFLSLLVAVNPATAQITLEHTYDKTSSVAIVKIEDDGYKFIGVDTASKDVQLFNANHSVWKTIPTKIPKGSSFYGGNVYASKKLFNTNGNIEVLVSYYTLTGSTYTYTTKIMDETGAEIQKFADVSYATLSSFGSSWKMICNRYGSSGANIIYDVYSLPGAYIGNLMVAKPVGNNGATEIYPNPMNTTATLRYTLPDGAHKGNIQVYSSTGQVIRTYAVTDAFNDILIERDQLPAGTYYYTLVADGYSSPAEGFIVQ